MHAIEKLCNYLFYNGLLCCSWMTLKILSAVAFGGYGICWAIKSINAINNTLICKRLDIILEVLNGIDSGLRRTIVYLRETKVLQPNDIGTM